MDEPAPARARRAASSRGLGSRARATARIRLRGHPFMVASPERGRRPSACAERGPRLAVGGRSRRAAGTGARDPAARRPPAVPAGVGGRRHRPRRARLSVRPTPRVPPHGRASDRPAPCGTAGATGRRAAADGQAAPSCACSSSRSSARWRSSRPGRLRDRRRRRAHLQQRPAPADRPRDDRLPRGVGHLRARRRDSLARFSGGRAPRGHRLGAGPAHPRRRGRPRSRTRRSGRTPASTRWASRRPRIDTLTGDPRGASTITQQLVRQRLLPEDVMQESAPRRAQDQGAHPVDPRHRLRTAAARASSAS